MSDNTPKIDIRPDHLQIVRDILQKHVPKYEVWAFGSRAKWLAKGYSDLDLCILADTALSFEQTGLLREAFEESDLPYKVDIVDWATTSESFRKIIEKDKIVVQKLGKLGKTGSDWVEVKLSDLGEVARGRSRHRPRYAEHLYGGNYPFIQTGDIKASDGRINSHEQTYSEAGLAQSRLWPTNTMCITIAANIAETGILSYPACFPDSVIGFIPNNDKCDVYFIEYLFRKLKKDLQRQAIGSVQDNINLQTFERLKFKIPPLNKQKKIAYFLNNLDNKITLNRQINQTLEAMAQALFKSWFVDFDPVIDNALDAGNIIPESLQARAELRQAVRGKADFKPLPDDIRNAFPSEFEESELGWIPKGWGYKILSEFGNVICGKTPSKNNNSFYGEDIPFIKIPDMHGNVFATRTADSLSSLGSKSQLNKLLPKDSICVSCIATVGLVVITSVQSQTNQQINSIISHKSFYRDYLYFSMLNLYEHFHDLASGGSATLNMNTSTFAKVKVMCPADYLLECFQSNSSKFLDKILSNDYENQTLTKLRDTLLPKLISGELSLEGIED